MCETSPRNPPCGMGGTCRPSLPSNGEYQYCWPLLLVTGRKRWCLKPPSVCSASSMNCRDWRWYGLSSTARPCTGNASHHAGQACNHLTASFMSELAQCTQQVYQSNILHTCPLCQHQGSVQRHAGERPKSKRQLALQTTMYIVDWVGFVFEGDRLTAVEVPLVVRLQPSPQTAA